MENSTADKSLLPNSDLSKKVFRKCRHNKVHAEATTKAMIINENSSGKYVFNFS